MAATNVSSWFLLMSHARRRFSVARSALTCGAAETSSGQPAISLKMKAIDILGWTPMLAYSRVQRHNKAQQQPQTGCKGCFTVKHGKDFHPMVRNFDHWVKMFFKDQSKKERKKERKISIRKSERRKEIQNEWRDEMKIEKRPRIEKRRKKTQKKKNN